jgi:predicted dehydrogenase
MNRVLRAGVVGTGLIGLAHVEALRRTGVEVAGVVGSSPERARTRFSGRVYDDLTSLLADPAVDAVHVASPNARHYEHAVAALKAGKHVVCEKPLGLSVAEGEQMAAAAEQAGVVAAVCFNVRFYALCHQTRAMVAAGDIGAPRLVSGAYLQDWLLQDTDWSWRLIPEEAGRYRAIADIGSHWLDLAAYVSGQQVAEVVADLRTLVPVRRHPAGPVQTFAAAEDGPLVTDRIDSDDAAGVLLRFSDGASGTLVVSQVSAGRKNGLSLEVSGSEASLAWHSENPDQLWIGHRGRPNELLARDPELLADAAQAVTGYPAGHVEGYPDTFRGLFAAVYADIARGQLSVPASYPTFADGLDALRVVDAVGRSSADRRWVAVPRPA